MNLELLIVDLLIILAAGFLAGLLCKQLNISLLVGYLVVGAVIGPGVFDLVADESYELESLARAGALFLLFSVGIEFSLEELFQMRRYFGLGGAVQMLLTAIPLSAVCWLAGMPPAAALLAAMAGAFSSTILVFKALLEWGRAGTPAGRRAIGILLFQDIALVPLMLLIPLLTQSGEAPTAAAFLLLAGKSLVFIAAVLATRWGVSRLFVPAVASLRSVELVVLFTLCLLGSVCWGAHRLGLPPAVGALAAGMMLSGNRLSKQVDSIMLPFRETFVAVFFVTLGTLLEPRAFLEEPLLLTAGLLGMLTLKAIAAGVALRLVGLSWKSAAGMGLGLAQLGEFSFLVLTEGAEQGLFTKVDYNRMLFIALGTLILTPQLLKIGLRWTTAGGDATPTGDLAVAGAPIQRALIVGAGPIGRSLTSRLELAGVEVCLLDLSPINLHPFEQQGFRTVAGDARDPTVLSRAAVNCCHLIVVCVPDDQDANPIVRCVREQNPNAPIVVRCRFQSNILRIRRAGAEVVVSEESEAAGALLRECQQIIDAHSA